MEMANATYGRSSKGINVLVKDLQGDLTKLDGVLSTKYSEIVSAVNKYWSGADADAFLKKLKAKYDDFNTEVKTFKKSLETTFANELANFKKQQGSIKI